MSVDHTTCKPAEVPYIDRLLLALDPPQPCRIAGAMIDASGKRAPRHRPTPRLHSSNLEKTAMIQRPTRRGILRTLAFAAGATRLDAGSVHAQSAVPAPPSQQLPGSCVLFPQAVEGPYYFDPKLVRANITEGRPGLPLKLVLKIIDKATCAPIANARVDVWHCDAGGIYSGYPRQGDDRTTSTEGQHYLRGTQTTDASGHATFETIYPGWYPGRTPHIHIKAFLDDKTVLTGQVYFPDDMSARIYKLHAPYNARPVADQTNATDFLFREGQREGGGIILAIEENATGVTGTLLIAVDRSGEAARRAGGLLQRIFGER